MSQKLRLKSSFNFFSFASLTKIVELKIEFSKDKSRFYDKNMIHLSTTGKMSYNDVSDMIIS